MVLPNYRGSTGFGEDVVQSLPGNVGSYDVQDCMTMLQAAIDKGVAHLAGVVVGLLWLANRR